MKRNLIIALAMLLLPVTASADDAEKEVKVPFSKGTSTLAFGFGLGTGYNFYNYYGYGYGYGFGLGRYTRLPSLLAYFDHGIIDNAGPGNIGVGGIVAWRSSTYRYSNGDKERMRNLIIGVRGTYHLTLPDRFY